MHNRLRTLDDGRCTRRAQCIYYDALVTHSVYYDALVTRSINIKCTYARIHIPAAVGATAGACGHRAAYYAL